MIRKMLKTIEKYDMLKQGERVVVGLSGGADSIALAFAFLKLGFSVSAVHVHHGLRGTEADSDESFVSRFCENYKIPLTVYHYKIYDEAKRLKLTPEEAGRLLRYNAFEEVRQQTGADKIAVAHNMNDNTETVLMRICRGTGLTGLCGIPPKRGIIIRPLIEIQREEIEEYCKDNLINYCIDSTNLEPIYTRNKIRLELLPFLENKFNPEVITGVSNMCELLNEENEYIEFIATKKYKDCLLYKNENELALDIINLSQYHKAVIRRVLRLAYTDFTGSIYDISSIHIENILSLLFKETGKMLNLPGSISVRREYTMLVLYKKREEPSGFSYDLTLDKPIYIKEANFYVVASLKKLPYYFNNIYTKIFCYDKMEDVMQIRNRRPGDKIFIKSMGGNKKIKNYFIDIKSPRNQRDKVPLLVSGSDVVWIIDKSGIVSDLYKADGLESKLYVNIYN